MANALRHKGLVKNIAKDIFIVIISFSLFISYILFWFILPNLIFGDKYYGFIITIVGLFSIPIILEKINNKNND